MITKDTWPESWAAVPAWTEVDEDIYYHFLNVLPPLVWVGSYFQVSEPYSHEVVGDRWRGRYLTFIKKDGKCWFLGIQLEGHYPMKEA